MDAFTSSGPTLSPVALLWATCEPSHMGKDLLQEWGGEGGEWRVGEWGVE